MVEFIQSLVSIEGGGLVSHIHMGPSVKFLLSRRGFRWLGEGEFKLIIHPTKALGSPEAPTEYYTLLKHYSFRKIIRHLVAVKEPVHPQDLLSMCSEPTLGQYREFLAQTGIIEVTKQEKWRLKQRVDSFGYTLEWYVSELMSRELGATSGWGVEIEGLIAGGDFDVLAFMDSVLIYVECKAKRPEEIEASEIRNFLQRSQDLAPELAVMLVDTDGDLRPVLDRFQASLLPIKRVRSGVKRPEWKPDKPFIAKVAGFRNLHFGLYRVFITDSQPTILHVLQDCLRHYYTYIKFASFLSGPRANYITGEVFDE